MFGSYDNDENVVPKQKTLSFGSFTILRQNSLQEIHSKTWRSNERREHTSSIHKWDPI